MSTLIAPKIYQLPTSVPATQGTLPNFKYMVSGDDLAAISTAGYLNQIDLQSNPVSSTDILQILFNFNPQTNIGEYGSFSVVISNGIITLIPTSVPGEIILPVAVGDFATWANISGSLHDEGYKPSNGALTNVAMVDISQTPSINNFAVFKDVNGSISDNQYSPSQPLLGTVAMVVTITPPVTGNIVEFADNSGSIVDSGIPSTGLVSLTSPPSIANYFAKFSNTSGGINSAPGTAINNGQIESGINGSRGSFICYPADPDSGNFVINCPSMLGNFSVAFQTAPFGQATNITIPDPINATAQLLIGPGSTPFINGNFPVATGNIGLMIDSGVSSSNIITRGGQPKLYVSQSAGAAQSLSDGVYTQVILDQIVFDTSAGFALNSYTVTSTGYYYVSYQVIVQLTGADTGVLLTCSLYLNEAPSQYLVNTGSIANSDLTLITSQCSGIMFLTSGDTLSLFAQQITGGSRTILSNGAEGNTFLSLTQVV